MNRVVDAIVESSTLGAWPADSAGQAYVLNTANGLDKWNRPMQYERRGIEFALLSAGPDGAWQTKDDLTLWVYHDASRDFFPNWDAGAYTMGLDAITSQLEP